MKTDGKRTVHYSFKASPEENEIIQKKIQNLISGLANVGLQSAQVSNDDLRVLLDGFMNGGDTTNFGTVMVK